MSVSSVYCVVCGNQIRYVYGTKPQSHLGGFHAPDRVYPNEICAECKVKEQAPELLKHVESLRRTMQLNGEYLLKQIAEDPTNTGMIKARLDYMCEMVLQKVRDHGGYPSFMKYVKENYQ